MTITGFVRHLFFISSRWYFKVSPWEQTFMIFDLKRNFSHKKWYENIAWNMATISFRPQYVLPIVAVNDQYIIAN